MNKNKIEPLQYESKKSFYNRLNRLKIDSYKINKTYKQLKKSINGEGK